MTNEEYINRHNECIISYIEYRCDYCNNIKVSKLSENSRFKYFKEFDVEHIDPGMGVVRIKIKTFCIKCSM